MFEFHKDKQRYFNWQHWISRDYVVPFVGQHIDLTKPLKVLEIGCAEAGVLKAFTDLGHHCTGIELSESRVELAKQFMQTELEEGKIELISKNIYDINPEADLSWKYDLIILKDVIEHIPGHSKFMQKLQEFLAKDGIVFFAFPPWYMPFGGHQQLATKKLTSKMPWYHILPKFLYKGILKLAGESKSKINDLIDIYDTRISIEKFQRLSKQLGYTVEERKLWLFNPIYQYKFKVKPRKQFGLISAIPFIRNFYSTCAYFVISKQ